MNAYRFPRKETIELLIGLTALGIACLFVMLSFFSFPAADDFEYFDHAKQYGFWGAQGEWYLRWSGRYSATAVMSVFSALPDIDRFYFLGPLSAIALSLIAVFVFLYLVGGREFTWRTVWVSSLAFWAIYISGLPNIAQSIYWDMGIATYQFANVSLLLLLAAAVWREHYSATSFFISILRFLATAVTTIVAVGSNELTMISVLTILTVLLVSAVNYRPESARFWLAILVIGTICSLFSGLAPGNALRAASLPTNGIIRPPAWVAVMVLVPWVVLRVVNWLANPALWASAVLLYFATRAQCHHILYRDGRFQNRWFYLSATWGFLIFAMYGVGFFVNHYPLPDRAESVVYLVFLIGCYPTLIMLTHRFVASPPLRASASIVYGAQILLVVSLVGSATVFEAVKDIYRGHRYSMEMSRRFEMIKIASNAGHLNPVVPSVTRPPRTVSVTELSTDSRELANVLMAKYYGLESVRLGDPNSGSSTSR